MKFNQALINGFQKVNDINKKTPLTKRQLFGALLDFNSFKENLSLKFIIKTLLDHELWNNLIQLINSNSKLELQKLVFNINNTYSFPIHLLDEIIFSLRMVIDWNDEWNPKSIYDNFYFLGIPICGNTYSFHEKLKKIGFRPTYEINCLEGPIYDISSCKIIFEKSYRYEPVWELHIYLPENLKENYCASILNTLKQEEKERRLLDHSLTDYENYMIECFYKSYGKEILIKDPWGHGCMVESPCITKDDYQIKLEFKDF